MSSFRTPFLDLSVMAGEPLRIGLPAIDGFAPLIRQLLPGAQFLRFPTIDKLVAAQFKRGHVPFERAYSYWIRGEGLYPRHPRWSIARNVLGWGLK